MTVLWEADRSLFDDLPEISPSRQQAAALYLATNPARFPLDHRLVTETPSAFAVRLAPDPSDRLDPRRPVPAAGQAFARLSSPAVWDLLKDEMTARFAAVADAGIKGLCLSDASAIDDHVLPALVATGRAAGLEIIVEADGLSDRHVAALKEAAPEAFLSSIDRSEPDVVDLIEEYERLRRVAPVFARIKTTRSGPDYAMLSDGLVIPEGADLPSVETNVGEAAPFHGEMRRLSGSAGAVTAILRADTSDIRHATRALLLLINETDEARTIDWPALLPSAGADFSLPPGGGEDLAPNEIRQEVLERAEPILLEPQPDETIATLAAETPRLVLEQVKPRVDGGDFPVKRIVGEAVTVEALLYGDGHEQLAAELHWRAMDGGSWQAVRMQQLPNDGWRAVLTLPRLGRYEFAVEGWLDRFGGFQRDFRKKREAGVAQPVDHAEGRALVETAVHRADRQTAKDLREWLKRLAAAPGEDASADLLLAPNIAALMDAADDRPHRVRSARQLVDAERSQAGYSSWYELFPRSETKDKSRHGTFLDVIDRLPAIRAMGFDTLYFPPIHPIGTTNRKGPNNTLTPGPDDVGSPYAIGSVDGGHDALHPQLGSFEDFGRLIAAAREEGLEIALDFAIQCSPDHPWLKEHPGWFAWRPDGSMKYAENPPKKYQDIVNVDFYGPDAIPDLWIALRDVVLFWISLGVKTFRVDNPHTKPLPFWEWMIGDVRAAHPDAIFLAEAFTRPNMMYRLAKIGFSQSYTYFTWRDGKQELTDYLTELTTTAPKDFYRPHFFVNTPDINPPYLQTSGRAGFRIRAVLAATLSGLFGIYSGFELCESAPIPGKEEYLDSEKYEIRPRDWNVPGNIIADITLLNRLRRAHPALQTHLNTRFYVARNNAILYYGKTAPDGSDMILVMVNLDPHHPHEAQFEVPLWEFGLPDDGSLEVEDLAAGHRFAWHGKDQSIRLDPSEPYRLWRIWSAA